MAMPGAEKVGGKVTPVAGSCTATAASRSIRIPGKRSSLASDRVRAARAQEHGETLAVVASQCKGIS